MLPSSSGVHYAGSVGYLVLDEADKMLSLGLQMQLDAIRDLVLPQQPATRKAAAPSQPQAGFSTCAKKI